MDIHNLPKIVLIVVFLVLHPSGSRSQWVPQPPIVTRPLCASQFALVNHACSLLPYNPGPPPSPPSPPPPPPSPPSPPERRHRHKHGRHHVHKETPVEEECCRWMKQVDSECVCDLLVRLPPFLSRPVHQYTVVVDSSCNVTFECGSRIKFETQMLPQFP
ncbi:PREDICTED: zinc finger protein 827-like [Nicotiana attenuata]|uniref:Bifunctional inhibitor/plant lipid transfer protein/seed storage helical domain-containing protein n=1 Tax=Nicotiana attenuata TaxID=49451 RepID=A0A1J6IV34_NICAT|nr:PREDICTED: zinc finger protein 827-like [Nicotiana attenuata]OIT08140.1 hypothetical protein A4A49_26051 [Nicotiana attenuata]